MNEPQKDYLRNCNSLDKNDLPYVKKGDKFFTPNGWEANPTHPVRAATHEEIVAAYDADNRIPVIQPSAWPVDAR